MFAFAGCAQKHADSSTNLPPPPTMKTIPFRSQWETFQRLGFELNPGIDKSVINELQKNVSSEREPYVDLYVDLGTTIQKEPWTPLTNRVWNFDVEAIEDHGAYVEIMKNLERISRGEIRFENLKDFVDIESEKAWVSFTVRGKSYRWDLKVEDDWADPGLFTKLVKLTEELNTRGRYTYFFTGGQDALIGYETPEGRDAIVKATGLKIVWLN
jgi:hypothetical protein